MKQSTGPASQLQATTSISYILPSSSIDSKFLKYFPPAANRFLPGEIISFFSDESDLTHLKQRDLLKIKEMLAQISSSLNDFLKTKEADYEQAIVGFYESLVKSKSLFHSKAKQFVERADSSIST